MKTSRTARYVIGFDGHDHVIYPHGEVVYEGDQVLFVGHSYPGEVDQTVDEGEAIISPGFIDLNALGDIDQSLLWSEAAERQGLMWSEAYVQAGPQEAMTAAEEAFKSRYALLQLLHNGITTALPVTGLKYKAWAESYAEYAAAAEFAAQIGLRTYLGPSYRSAVEFIRADGSLGRYEDEPRGEHGLEEAVRFIQAYDGYGDGLIHGLLVPSQLQTCTPDLLRRTKATSDELGCPVRLHAAQSSREFAYSMATTGKTPLGFLHAIDFLGPQILIPHATHVSGSSRVPVPGTRDLDLLRDTGATVIHCPLLLAREGILLESFEGYLQHGISLALGTDTFPPDMLQNLRAGVILNELYHEGQTTCRPADFFRAATLGGAQALGRSDIGRLAQGSKADLIVLSLEALSVGPYDDPVETMAFSMNSSDIRTVVIGGRVVMEGGEVPGIDNAQLRHQSQAYFEKLKASFARRDYKQRAPDELFRASFRVISPE